MALMDKDKRKTICIIGAGAAGLCAARNCMYEPNTSVTIFEQGSRLGGTWVYDPDLDSASIQSSMYESLVTNLPKEVMAFREFPFTGFSSDSFVKREVVLKYLEAYAKPIAQYIEYKRRVISVEPVNISHVNGEISPTRISKDVTWKVCVESTHATQSDDANDKIATYYFDCVFVCNGHLSSPKYPRFASKYKKRAIHSHRYRKPQPFAGKKVAVIGAGPSGCDISTQIAGHAAEVFLLYKETVPDVPPFGQVHNDAVKISAVVDADAEALYLAGGARVADFDDVIYCTGYNYEFPFLSHFIDGRAYHPDSVSENRPTKTNGISQEPRSTDVLLRLQEDGRVIGPLFAHLAHVDYLTSLYFIGLPFITIPFVLFEQQVNFAIALMNGRLFRDKVLNSDDIALFEMRRYQELEQIGASRHMFHKLGRKQWEHYDWLWQCYAERSKLPDQEERLRRLRVPPVVGAIYRHTDAERRKDVEKYHTIKYEILNDEEFNTIFPDDYPYRN